MGGQGRIDLAVATRPGRAAKARAGKAHGRAAHHDQRQRSQCQIRGGSVLGGCERALRDAAAQELETFSHGAISIASTTLAGAQLRHGLKSAAQAPRPKTVGPRIPARARSLRGVEVLRGGYQEPSRRRGAPAGTPWLVRYRCVLAARSRCQEPPLLLSTFECIRLAFAQFPGSWIYHV